MTLNDDSVGARVDGVCEDFEQRLANGESPQIEHSLASWREPERSNLLRELLRIENELLLKSGRVVNPTEYMARFPNHQHLVKEIVGQAGRAERSNDDLLLELLYAIWRAS